jgi:alkyl hydroperoxide reductase subunit AhpC
MPEEFKPGCQRPAIKKLTIQADTATPGTLMKEEKTMIKVGKPAPDFTAAGFYNGKFANFNLSEYKGKWVLLCFYPGDFTFVWATEISAVAEKHSELQELGVEVLSCSVDSIYVHKMWNDYELTKMINKDIPFTMLSDQDGSIGKMYGIYDEDSGVETRGRFIIDPDGIVQGFEVLTPSVGRNVSESTRQVKAFQLVRNSQGTEATPSGWKPGKPTLKPSPELVGNVWKEWKVSQAFDD